MFLVSVRFRIEQPVYINIIRDPINRFLSNYFFRRFGDWRGEQNHLIRTPGMKDDERYLVRNGANFNFNLRVTGGDSNLLVGSSLVFLLNEYLGPEAAAGSHPGRSLSPVGLESVARSARLSPRAASPRPLIAPRKKHLLAIISAQENQRGLICHDEAYQPLGVFWQRDSKRLAVTRESARAFSL